MARTGSVIPSGLKSLQQTCAGETARKVECAVDLRAAELVGERLEWERLRPACEGAVVELDVVLRQGGPRHLRIDVMELPGLGLSWFDAAGVEMWRSDSMAARNLEGFTLSFAVAGRFRAWQDGREVDVDANAGVLLDGMRASRISVPAGVRFVGIRLDSCCRELVSELLTRRGDGGLAVLSNQNPAFTAIRAFVRELADPRLPLLDTMVPLVRSRMLALVRSALVDADQMRAANRLRDAALAMAERHLDDPFLSAADLADWLGVPEDRVLCAVVGDCGADGSAQFHRMLTRLRVAALARRLRDLASRGAQIGEVFLEAGFADEATARAAFMEVFGVEPELWRTMRLA